jgi:hypothetical protein
MSAHQTRLAGATTPAPILTVPSTLFLGPAGSGKSDALTSALEFGKKLFVISTEANGLDSIINSFRRRRTVRPDLSLDNLYWQYIPPATLDTVMMLQKAKLANTNDVGDLQKLAANTLYRDKFPQFANLIRSFANLKDDRTQKVIGNIADLDDNWVLALDSLTSLTTMVTQNCKGIRPTTNQGEIGVIQELIRDLINNLTSLRCFFVLTAHIERETDEISQRERVMASTIGKKLAPQIPLYFSEVVKTYADNDGFWGSTIDPDATVKARYYPRAAKFPLTLGPVINGYEANKKLLLDSLPSAQVAEGLQPSAA